MRPGAQIVATQRLMENRQRGAASAADEWQRRAELALRAGDEDLARAALTRRKSYQVLLGPGCSLSFVMVFGILMSGRVLGACLFWLKL